MTRYLFCCLFACSLNYFFLSRFLSFMLSFRPSSFLFLIIPILRPAWANLGNYKKGKIIDSLLLSMEIITIRFLYQWWDISIWTCQRYGKTSHWTRNWHEMDINIHYLPRPDLLAVEAVQFCQVFDGVSHCPLLKM